MAPRESVATLTETELLEAARGGDEAAFARLVEPHHGLLHAHCYRMLGSVHDAEDALQDALLRAWKGLPRFAGPQRAARVALQDRHERVASTRSAGGPSGRCRSTTARRGRSERRPRRAGRRDRSGSSRTRTCSSDGPAGPDARYEQREGVELAFVAALQHLPASAARRADPARGARLLGARDGRVARHDRRVGEQRAAAGAQGASRSGCPSAEPAGDAARARRRRRSARSSSATSRRGSAATSMRSCRCSPRTPRSRCRRSPAGFRAATRIAEFLRGWPLSGRWRWRHVAGIRANGQPAIGCYAWNDEENCFRPFALEVLTLRGTEIAEINCFVTRGADRPEGEYAEWPDHEIDRVAARRSSASACPAARLTVAGVALRTRPECG